MKVTRHMFDTLELFARPVLGQTLLESITFGLLDDDGFVRAPLLAKLGELTTCLVQIHVRSKNVLHARLGGTVLFVMTLLGQTRSHSKDGAFSIIRGSIMNFGSKHGARMTELTNQRFIRVATVPYTARSTVVKRISENTSRMQRGIERPGGAGEGRFPRLVMHAEGERRSKCTFHGL